MSIFFQVIGSHSIQKSEQIPESKIKDLTVSTLSGRYLYHQISRCWFQLKVQDHEQLLKARRNRRYHLLIGDAFVYIFQVSDLTKAGS